MVNWSNSRAGPAGAAELGQCATSSVAWWQRHSFDRKCKTIPQRTRQETGKSRVKTEESPISTDELIVSYPPGSPFLMPLT